jgi:transcription elongation factor Elf1
MRPKPLRRSVLSNARDLPRSPLANGDIKIIRCRYCGDESRMTLAWMRSHATFQCDGCGEKFSLEKRKISKALNAVVKAFDDLRQKLPRW